MDLCLQCLAFYERHCEKEGLRVAGSVVEQRQNIGMMQMAEDLYLPMKTGLANGCCDFRPKDFYRNRLLSDEIIRQNDVRGSALANYPPEYVTRR